MYRCAVIQWCVCAAVAECGWCTFTIGRLLNPNVFGVYVYPLLLLRIGGADALAARGPRRGQPVPGLSALYSAASGNNSDLLDGSTICTACAQQILH